MLQSNTCIERLDLEGNAIESDGAIFISRVLRENLYINHLVFIKQLFNWSFIPCYTHRQVLSENKLGTRGAEAVCEMLHDNHTIALLDLSGNGLKDSDGEFFYNLLLVNDTNWTR